VQTQYNTHMNKASNILPKPGQRVECIEMHGESLPSGARGTVVKLDSWAIPSGDHGQVANIHVAWDNGFTLALLSDVDTYKVLTAEDEM